ncbi:hypothetical protein [Pseudoduganella violacea]|uniref:Tfp pilus assembly protein PilN n=1 Tax=Pseudoduganella violacea TaxID=1715466 RepID=A0A7W5BBA6_9BURK|nr:hypothetical protein [Pseudoduganella violacea]MBB3119635.1 Tfp pilus assembly protein PilN [Pseudoduganella violacea]
MRRMQIDFAPPGWRRAVFRLRPLAVFGAVLGLGLCAGAGLAAWEMAQKQQAREAQLQAIQRKAIALSKAPPPVAAVAIPEAQAQAVNAAILQLNLPWNDLQDAVAAATPRHVALLALDPDARKRLLKITAETKNADEMIAYIEELKQQEFFSAAALLRHEVNEQDPNRPIRFQVEVQWRAP